MPSYRYYGVNPIIPPLFAMRFITIITHLVILILILANTDGNVKTYLGQYYSTSDYTTATNNMMIWVGLSIGFLGVELISSLLAITTLKFFQTFISILCHSIAVLSLFPYYVDSWSYDQIRWIFGFCTVLPCITEAYAYIDLLACKKRTP